MVKRQNRTLTALFILGDLVAANLAFLFAYLARFELHLIPITKGKPPLAQYMRLLPLVSLVVPLVFFAQGLYKIRRGRARIDELMTIFVAVTTSVALLIGTTLFIQIYYKYGQPGLYEVSQIVWALFLLLAVILVGGERQLIRTVLEHRWKAGLGLKRVLVAGAGDLGRMVADKLLEHREFGYRLVGFVDDMAAAENIGYRGLPLLGTLTDTSEVVRRETIDQLYVALPLEQHVKMLELIGSTSRELIDVKVVPDLLQFIAIRAGLEDLDGIPIINLNEAPLRGWNSLVKRLIDVTLSAVALVVLAIPFAVVAVLIKLTSRGPVFYKQERMGLDGKSFMIYKFRSMYHDAERETGPTWARPNDPRRTPIGRLLRRFSLDELPQLFNVLTGDMALVGPRPERPLFVEQFKQRFPQYMLRHKVKSGITGWAQVNGWRGNTSIEKRIEYDLYYIENWSVSLDLKIMWMTLWKGLFHKHAY